MSRATQGAGLSLELSLGLGPLAVELCVQSAEPLAFGAERLLPRLHPFARPAVAGPERLVVELTSPDRSWPRPGGCDSPRLTLSATGGGGYHVRRWDIEATVDPRLERLEGEICPTSGAIEACLRVLLWLRLIEGRPRGLLVHAASTVEGGRGYVFPADSGTGKSTLARLTPGELALCDEFTLLTEGEDGAWRIWPSPFWNFDRQFGPAELAGRSWPLHAVGLIEQAPQTRFRPLAADEALVRLLRQVVRHEGVEGAEAALFTAVADMLGTLPSDRVGALALRRGESPYWTAASTL